MAATGTLTLTGTITGLLTGTKSFLATVLNANASGATYEVILQSGANTITIPSGAVGCVISPPANNAADLTLKGVTGDTGILLHKTNPFALSFGTGQASFVLNASTLTSVPTEISFI